MHLLVVGFCLEREGEAGAWRSSEGLAVVKAVEESLLLPCLKPQLSLVQFGNQQY